MQAIRLDKPPACPVHIFACENGSLMFRPVFSVATYDYKPDGVTGIFDRNGFSLKGEADEEYSHYDYDIPYPYKTMDLLKAWVLQQNLIGSPKE